MRALLAPLLAIALVFTSVAGGVVQSPGARAAQKLGQLQARSDGEKAIIAPGSGPSRSQLTGERSGKRGLFSLPLLMVLPSRPGLSVPVPQSTTQAIPLFVLQKDVGAFRHPARAPPCLPVLS
jgi:hypothetical protein